MENSITNGKLVESIMEKSEANAWCMFQFRKGSISKYSFSRIFLIFPLHYCNIRPLLELFYACPSMSGNAT